MGTTLAVNPKEQRNPKIREQAPDRMVNPLQLNPKGKQRSKHQRNQTPPHRKAWHHCRGDHWTDFHNSLSILHSCWSVSLPCPLLNPKLGNPKVHQRHVEMLFQILSQPYNLICSEKGIFSSRKLPDFRKPRLICRNLT